MGVLDMTDKLLEDFFRPLGAGQLSIVSAMATRMVEFGLSAADIADMVGSEHRRRMRVIVPANAEHNQPMCPICGNRVLVTRVNETKCTMVGGGYTHMLSCSDMMCPYNELITRG